MAKGEDKKGTQRWRELECFISDGARRVRRMRPGFWDEQMLPADGTKFVDTHRHASVEVILKSERIYGKKETFKNKKKSRVVSNRTSKQRATGKQSGRAGEAHLQDSAHTITAEFRSTGAQSAISNRAPVNNTRPSKPLVLPLSRCLGLSGKDRLAQWARDIK